MGTPGRLLRLSVLVGFLSFLFLAGCGLEGGAPAGRGTPSSTPAGTPTATATLSPTATPTATPTSGPTPTPTEDPILARLRAYAGEPGGCRWMVVRSMIPRRLKRDFYDVDVYVLACTLRDLKALDERFDPTFLEEVLRLDDDALLPTIWYNPRYPDSMGWNALAALTREAVERTDEAYRRLQPIDSLDEEVEIFAYGGHLLPRPITRALYGAFMSGVVQDVEFYGDGIPALSVMRTDDGTRPVLYTYILRYTQALGRYEMVVIEEVAQRTIWEGDRESGYRFIRTEYVTPDEVPVRYVYLTGVMAEPLRVYDPYLTYYGLNPEAVQPFVVAPALRGALGEYARDLRVERVHLLCVFPEGVYEPRPLREPPEMTMGFVLWAREVPSTGSWGPSYAQAALGLPYLGRDLRRDDPEVSAQDRWRRLARDLARSRPLQVVPFREALERGMLPYGDIYRAWFEGGEWKQTVRGFLKGYAPAPSLPLSERDMPWARGLPLWWLDLPDLEARSEAYPFDPPIPSPYEDREGDGWEWYVLWLPEDRAVIEGADGTLAFLFQVFPRYPMQWERRRDLAEKVSTPMGGWGLKPRVDLEEATRTAWMGCMPVGQVRYLDTLREKEVGPEWMPGVESVYVSTGSFFRRVRYYPRPKGRPEYWLHPADLVRPLRPGVLRGLMPEGTFFRLDEEALNRRDYRGLRAHAHLLVPWYPPIETWQGLTPLPPDDRLPSVPGLDAVLRSRPWFLDPAFYEQFFGG